jgi:small ligand-binding sensory domain FIST
VHSTSNALEEAAMNAEAAIAAGENAVEVLEALLAQLSLPPEPAAIDLVLLFASDAYLEDLPAVLAELKARTGAKLILGCSGQGLIGPAKEEEHQAAMALQVMSLPGATVTPLRLSADEAGGPDAADILRARIGSPEADVNALIMFVDPFTVDGERLLETVAEVDDQLPVVGGLASARFNRRGTYLLLDDAVFDDGVVGLALGGAYEVKTVVSQGAAPLGQTWTITGVDGNVIYSIGMRRAIEVLGETYRRLKPEVQVRARANFLIGLAMNEYQDEFGRGDFLVRNLLSIDRESGALAVGAMPREGQTLQFQMRDPGAADEDLRSLLGKARQELEGREIAGALLCSCNGRGIGLFGEPDHDARVFMQEMGSVPVAGFFCNGEIGPVAGRNYLHGFTASIALILPKES